MNAYLVTLEGQMIKWSQIELARAITCTFIHCYAPQLRANWFGSDCQSVHLPSPTPPPSKNKIYLDSLKKNH